VSRRLSFDERLEWTRRLADRRHELLDRVPLHERDQIAAAAVSTRNLVDLAAIEMRARQPERGWHGPIERPSESEPMAVLAAAVLDCLERTCVHLRREGPQPAVVSLPLRRVDCRRCAATVRRPPAGDSDRCDVCGQRGVITFVPFVCGSGPLLVLGDACPSCASRLRLSGAAA